MAKLCIIPARGGSKRIPKKNIKNFLGKPIIAYSIEAALKSRLFDEVMVSTNDNQIAKIAKKFGAKVPFLRSEKNSDDFATTYDVIEEVIYTYKKNNQEFETVCCIYATAPFVTPLSIINAYNLMINKGYNSVFPVLEFSFPIQRALKIDSSNKIQLFQPEYLNTRSQDLEKAYHDVGQFYWFITSKVLEIKKIWTNNTGVIVLEQSQGQDIDTIEDWELAEIKYKLLHEKKTNI